MKRIVLFASGSGSNVENIANHFHNMPNVAVAMVLTNKRDAKVLDRCNRLNISSICFNRTAFYGSNTVLELLRAHQPDLIVLAGFLWKVPESLINAFPGKIINIHPALLPKYGGKGMFGDHVHQAVKDNKEPETGITIHYVDENYDEGSIIFQASVKVDEEDSVHQIAEKVHRLEYVHYPKVIEKLLFP